MALVFTEEGVAATKVVSSADEFAVFGIAVTGEGAAAGAVVATDEGVAASSATLVAPDEPDWDERAISGDSQS